jgi:hypothetical protein
MDNTCLILLCTLKLAFQRERQRCGKSVPAVQDQFMAVDSLSLLRESGSIIQAMSMHYHMSSEFYIPTRVVVRILSQESSADIVRPFDATLLVWCERID